MRGRKKKPTNDFSAVNLFMALLLGFFLGSIMVYWQFNRQNDRIIKEVTEKIVAIFSDNSPNKLPVINGYDKNGQSSSEESEQAPGFTQDLFEVNSNGTLIVKQDYPGTNKEHSEKLKRDNPGNETDKSVFPRFLEDETYSLARDKLIHSRIISVYTSPSSTSESGRLLDSVIGNQQNSFNEQVVLIEFWESPLNSVGYKMSKTRIIFYGIKVYELAEINYHQGRFYLSYMNDIYPLDFTNTFKPLIPQSTSLHF